MFSSVTCGSSGCDLIYLPYMCLPVDGDILRLNHETGLSYTMTRVVESDTAPATDNASEPVSE